LLRELSDLAGLFSAAAFEVHLEAAAFYREQGTALPEVPFLDALIYRFCLDDICQQYHLSFRLTA